MLHRYYHNGISPATRNTYSFAQQSYLKFCSAIQCSPTPAHASTLLLFVTHLATSGLSHTSIKVYLSTICSMHVATGWHIIFNQQLTPRLQQVLRGIQRTQAISTDQKTNHPGHHEGNNKLTFAKGCLLWQYHDVCSLLYCLLWLSSK